MMKSNLPFDLIPEEDRPSNGSSPTTSGSPENRPSLALIKTQHLLHQQILEKRFGRNLELLQQSQDKPTIPQYSHQVESSRHRSNSTNSSPTSNVVATLGAGSPRDLDPKERHGLRFIKQKSLNDQSAIASPEVKKHLQEFVLQKKRKEASLVNLKSEVGNASSPSSSNHPILRKTASESNLLKMKSKRIDLRSSVIPYARQPVIPEGSVVHDSAPSSPLVGGEDGATPSSLGLGSPGSYSSHVPPPPSSLNSTPPTTTPSHHLPFNLHRHLMGGSDNNSNNSKSLPNIPSAIGGRASLLGKTTHGRRSPPGGHPSNRILHHSAMMVRRTKSSAILPLRKHLIEKQRSVDEDQYFQQQQKLTERYVRSTILEEDSSISALMETDDERLMRSSSGSMSAFLVQSELSPLSTGLGFDSIMLSHTCKCGNDAAHIENPNRVSHIWNRLVESGLVAHCKRISRKATLEEIQSCHSENHTLLYGSDMITRKSGTSSYGPKFSMLECGGIGVDSDTYWNTSFTSEALRTAVGTLIEVSEMVVNDELKNGFAIIRPPGHHAEYEEAMGFCYFNSVGITAHRLLLSPNVNRVLILDWAIHHGNGTQKAFYDNPNVLYISLHRHDNGNFYPGTGSLIECGHGAGLGFNVNIAWTGDLNPPMGDAEYLAAFRNIVMPIAREYNPDVVLVSAGFDAAVGHSHPIGGYTVSTACFAYMTLQLQQIAGGKVVLALEGGYNLSVLSTASEQCVRALLKLPIDKISEAELARRPCDIAVETLQKTLAIQALYWNSLKTRCETAFLSHLEAWERERVDNDALSAMATLSMQQHHEKRYSTPTTSSALPDRSNRIPGTSPGTSSSPITISYY